jgi:hypothetical protein
MGSTNPDVEKVFDRQSANDEENVNSSNTLDPVPDKEQEPEFDTGLKTWLQVLGSFFLFFNSWYGFLPTVLSNIVLNIQIKQGHYQHLGCISNLL